MSISSRYVALLVLLGALFIALLWAQGLPSAAHPRTPPGVTVDRGLKRAGRARSRNRPMRPSYITIHATENRSRGTNAYAHAQMQKRGALTGRHNAIGYVSWHFTVDDHSIYQSLPTDERGEHADYDGMGNRSSIGIEMCENRGDDRAATIDRTARLVLGPLRSTGSPSPAWCPTCTGA